MNEQIPLNPIETAPELKDIIVFIQPPIPNRMPRFARTYHRHGYEEWADIPTYDWPDIVGWVPLEAMKDMVKY